MKTPQERFIEDYENKASKGKLDLEEYVTDGDCRALEQITRSVSREGMRVVEIGSWKGNSTSVLGKIAKEHNGKVFAVDHWQGNVGGWNESIAETYDVFAIFRNNIKLLGLKDTVCALVMDSESASSLFPDGSLDLVFLDADHRYEYIKQDIKLWLPKVRRDGILCGHDCEVYYATCEEELRTLVDDYIDEDVIHGVCHPGVVRAVHEYFGAHYTIGEGSRVWYYVKT